MPDDDGTNRQRVTERQPVAYIRRSVARRGDPGDVSREFQTEKVRSLANGDGPTLRILDGDWGKSAATDKVNHRLAFLAMLEDIEAGRVSHVYAYAPDRLARSVEWAARLVNVCRRAGVPITTTAGTVAPDDPAARAMFNMLAVMNETALDEMEHKARSSIDVRRNRGDTIGQRPYGEVRTRKDGVVVGADEDAAVVLDAFREAGSYFGAARILNDRKVPTRNGAKWYPRTVQRIVNRYDRHTVPLGVRRGVRTLGSRMLSGLLWCHCGARMGQTVSGEGTPRYRCPIGAADPTHSRPYIVPERKLLPAVMAEAARLKVPGDVVQLREASTAALAALETKRDGIGDAYAAGAFGPVGSEAARAKLTERLAAIDEEAKEQEAVEYLEAIPQSVDFTQPPEIVNTILRAMWSRVELGPDLRPLSDGFVWRRKEWRAR
jgi:DNA invertase Pin-like site-specific DNA recombinase